MKKEVKDKKVKIYRVETARKKGHEIKIKRYIHDEKSGGLWAYVRDLTDRERFAALAVQVEQTIVFKITHNKKIAEGGFYIEFGGATYKAASTDNFEFYKTDLVFKGERCEMPAFDEVQYDEY